MIDKNDWRLTGQEAYLNHVEMIRVIPAEYTKAMLNKKNWHEHCEFCMDEIDYNNEEVFFVTEDKYHWICKSCFDDFKDLFDWKIK